ncbi:MAG TPA: hypothetical protein VE077_12340 [Candidatus Methylomirabilis sp.]|nr:hypothetical protein [Candidatus Methylomirabilis sp.]
MPLSRGSVFRRALFLLLFALAAAQATPPTASPQSLELKRAVRPWEFLSTLGMRAGLLGNEAGRMEGWVYPLKIFRDFHLKFHVDGRVLEADSFARTLITRPESSTIVYAGDTFSVRETFFVPVKEPGALIAFDIETETPLEIEAVFRRDFQLMWPAALGGIYIGWNSTLHAFELGEEQRKFAAVVGSPSGTGEHEEFQTNYSESEENSFRLGGTAKGRDTKFIAIAGSMNGRAELENTYRRLTARYADLLSESAKYYRDYLDETVSLALPDEQIQKAYDWSRISLAQGMVTNPFLGTGLVAGYRTSGQSQRPGFAWYFGRDSCWSSLALNADGDFADTKAALEFISKFQREDGKIPHEISQGASFVDWFKGYPYPYASADATPLYIIAADDYVTASGDGAFAKEKWDSLWKAYQFLKSTYDSRGLPQNQGVGHGWVEGGPLLPVKTEFYQSGLGAQALHALSDLARFAGHDDAAVNLEKEFEKQRALVNESFWIADKKRFAFALDKNDKQVDEPTVLATVPMWFGLPSDAQAIPTIQQIADADVQTDWGMRIISNRSPVFSGGGYHFGSVWPLFTGWASVAEYKYHQEFPAYENLRANALLTLDGSLGHVTEVLSGDYYQPLSTSSPHQIWSAAMVVSPTLKGMLGLERNAADRTLTFVPHVPADWTDFKVNNVKVGDSVVNLSYHKTLNEITLEATRTGGECTLDFEPELANSALVGRVDMNGQTQRFDQWISAEHHHVKMKFPLAVGKNIVRIRVQNDFGLAYDSRLPKLGSASSDLRIISEEMGDVTAPMVLETSGRPGATYDMTVWNPGLIDSVDGAALVKDSDGHTKLRIRFAENANEDYVHQKIVIHLHPRKLPRKKASRD